MEIRTVRESEPILLFGCDNKLNCSCWTICAKFKIFVIEIEKKKSVTVGTEYCILYWIKIL